MALAVITDSSAYLESGLRDREGLFLLDVPITIDGVTYVEGINLTIDDFYWRMAGATELPKTSQPSLDQLDSLLASLPEKGYTHVIGLFLSSGISGFYQNIHYLVDEHPRLTIAFPDTKITSAPLGSLVRNALNWAEAGQDFDTIVAKIDQQIARSTAFIMVDDLKHLVKGGRLSNSSAILGTLLAIKPILYFTDKGTIEVFEKVRTEKKAVKRLLEILSDWTADGDYEIAILHTNAQAKAEELLQALTTLGKGTMAQIVPLNCVIATHLGEGAVAFGITPML